MPTGGKFHDFRRSKTVKRWVEGTQDGGGQCDLSRPRGQRVVQVAAWAAERGVRICTAQLAQFVARYS